MNKHTPGPWDAGTDGAEIAPTSGPCAFVELCRVVGPWDGSTWYDTETAKANGLLIAAAPDLLKACEAALASEPCVCAEIADTEAGACLACVLFAAIAKAKGGGQ